MRALLLGLLVGLLVLSVGQPVAAQSPAQPRVVILHDVKDDGYTFVGNPNQFAFMLLNDDGTTNVHRNGRVSVTQNGVVLYETLGSSTAHDYDALNTFLVTFPVEGPYQVYAEVPITGGVLNATFTGYAYPRELAPAKPVLEGPKTAVAGTPVKFSYQNVDANGTLIDHSDALFEVRDDADDRLLFRTHLHSHDAAQHLQYTFAEAGTYVVRVVGYQAFPTKSGTAFAPVTDTMKVQVAAAQGAPAGVPKVPTTMEAQPAPAEGFKILTTFDPDRTVGMFGNMRLNTLVYDPATKAMVAHVDFTAKLTDPDGRVLFESESLHEYDGHLEIVTANKKVGTYRLDVTAIYDDWKQSRVVTFDVAPPVVGASPNPSFGAGPMIVTAKGLDAIKAGVPQNITFTASTAGGAPWQHSEIELQVNTAKPFVPIYLNKLHTHSDGIFTVAVNFPTAGDYVLVLDAEGVHRDPATSYSYGKMGDSIVVPVKVAPGVDLEDITSKSEKRISAGTASLAPGAPFLLLLAAVAIGLGFRGRST